MSVTASPSVLFRSLPSMTHAGRRQVTTTHFRPNFVVDGIKVHEEDNWQHVVVGDTLRFRVTGPCSRCNLVLNNIAQRFESSCQPYVALESLDVKLVRSFKSCASRNGRISPGGTRSSFQSHAGCLAPWEPRAASGCQLIQSTLHSSIDLGRLRSKTQNIWRREFRLRVCNNCSPRRCY